MTSKRQTVFMKCPFCDKGDISIIIIPAGITIKRAFAASNSKPIPQSYAGDTIVVNKECPFCHKSDKEIRKALISKETESKPKSKEELKKQLEELGLTGKL